MGCNISRQMNIIHLPVAPLSRKILLAEYGPEPIHLGERNLLYRQMCYRVDRTPWLKRHQQLLTTSIQISINKHLWEKVRQEPHQVGYHLYELHKDRMFTWVSGRVSGVDKEQLKAIRKYLEMYQVEEDEFGLDTAYRIWKRFKENRLTNTPPNVPYLSTGFHVKLSPQQAIMISAKVSDLSEYWCPHLHQSTRKVFKPYFLCRFTDLTIRQAANLLQKKYQSVGRSVKRGDVAVEIYPQLKEIIDYSLLTLEPQATP